eukprot:88332-Rhodomonas_salina.1
MIRAACDAYGGAVRSEVNFRQRIPHLPRNVTNVQAVALPQSTASPTPPALDLPGVQNGASKNFACRNAHGSAAGPKVDGRQRITHLPRIIAARDDVALPQISP